VLTQKIYNMKPEVHKVTITKGPNQFQRRLEFEKAKREIRDFLLNTHIMKIISKYKDYYDGGGVYGIDENVTFVRTIDEDEIGEDISIDKLPDIPSHFGRIKKDDVIFDPFFFGFCGVLHLVYKVTTILELDEDGSISKSSTRYVYDNDIIPELEKLKAFKRNTWYYKNKIAGIKELLNTKVGTNAFGDIYKEHNTPFFIINNLSNNLWTNKTNGKLYKHISLKNIQFFNIKDMLTAFQDIAMFLPILIPEPISEMTDEQKIQSHGLDETSFRCQAPGNKKEKRRKNKARKRNK